MKDAPSNTRPTRQPIRRNLTVSLATLVGLGLVAGLGAQQAARTAHVSTIATDLPIGTGGMEVGRDGTIFVSDFGARLRGGPPGTKVLRVTPAGQVSLFADGLAGATGSVLLDDGRFIQANIQGHRLSVITPDGRVSPLTSAPLYAPVGVTLGADGHLYVANCGNHTVSRVTLAGEVTLLASGPLFRCPNGIAQGADGHLYVSNFFNGDVVRVRLDGTSEGLVTLPGNNNGHLLAAGRLLYVAGRGAHQIFEVTLEGAFKAVAGSGVRGHDDGEALAATLSLPNDLALSPDGAILYFNEVEPLGPDDQVLTPTRVRALSLR